MLKKIIYQAAVLLLILPSIAMANIHHGANGFVFEGHVPSKFIKRFLLEEHPKAIGLSVPAMPVGSPGMEVAEQFMPYTVFIIYQDGSYEPYAKVESYESQFD